MFSIFILGSELARQVIAKQIPELGPVGSAVAPYISDEILESLTSACPDLLQDDVVEALRDWAGKLGQVLQTGALARGYQAGLEVIPSAHSRLVERLDSLNNLTYPEEPRAEGPTSLQGYSPERRRDSNLLPLSEVGVSGHLSLMSHILGKCSISGRQPYIVQKSQAGNQS